MLAVFTAFLAVALLSGPPAWSQDDAAPEPAPAEESGEESGESGDRTLGDAAGAEDGESEESETDDRGPAVGLDEIPELDQQTHEEDDDEFIPTEEIPVDQSIPFPTDI